MKDFKMFVFEVMVAMFMVGGVIVCFVAQTDTRPSVVRFLSTK